MNTDLNRTLGLSRLVLYGAGTILGAGIYVLVGQVAARSGQLSALAFVIAALVVAFSAWPYAMMARRLPSSAGAAAYVDAGFGQPWLSRLVGCAVILVGVISAATIARGIFGYLAYYVPWPHWLVSLVFVSALTWLAGRQVGLSVGVAAAATVLEVTGLCLVIAAAGDNWGRVFNAPAEYFVPGSVEDLRGIGLGAYLAFYACIGFEDMVNMAEEVEHPERNLPLSILIVLAGTTLLYVLVTLAALVSVPLEALAASEAPLALVIETTGFMPLVLITGISAIAVTNGALIQIIMGSRVLYGMARKGLAPRGLCRLNARTRSPHTATLVVGLLVLLFALALPLATLAQLTSTLILGVFVLVNLSLLRLNWRERRRGVAALGIPLTGVILCLLFVIIQLVA